MKIKFLVLEQRMFFWKINDIKLFNLIIWKINVFKLTIEIIKVTHDNYLLIGV